MSALGRFALFCLRHAREPGTRAAPRGVARPAPQARSAPSGKDALPVIWQYILIISKPEKPEDLVEQLLLVVGQEGKEEVMSVADWLEQKGRKQHARKTLLRQLRARFGEVPASVEVRIQAAEEDQLDTWLDRILSAPTLDDVLAGA